MNQAGEVLGNQYSWEELKEVHRAFLVQHHVELVTLLHRGEIGQGKTNRSSPHTPESAQDELQRGEA